MAAPTNISGPTAIDLGAPPWNVTQNVHDAGTTYTVWYKFTTLVDGELGLWGTGGAPASGYVPELRILGPDSFVTPSEVNAAINVPIQLPVFAGQTWYFRFITSSAVVSPAVLTIAGQMFTQQDWENGDIFVPDDTPSFPGVVISQDDALPVHFISPFPAGEAAAINHGTGIILTANRDTGVPALYTREIELITLLPSLTSYNLFWANGVDKFYACLPDNGASGAEIRTVTDAGVVSAVIATLTHFNIGGIAVSPDETILYYHVVSGVGFNSILRWDLVNDVALSALTAAIPGYNLVGAREILCLSDGTVIKTYVSNPQVPTDYMIKRFNADGTVANTYGPFTEAPNVGNIMRMAYALDSPTSFWIWYEATVSGVSTTPSGVSIFLNIRVSDGSVISDSSSYHFSAGVYQGEQTLAPQRFGHSESCPFLILSLPTIGGVYFVDSPSPTERHDIYYDTERKIPDPTIRTALIGE